MSILRELMTNDKVEPEVKNTDEYGCVGFESQIAEYLIEVLYHLAKCGGVSRAAGQKR